MGYNTELAFLAPHVSPSSVLLKTHANSSFCLDLSLIPLDGFRKMTVPSAVFFKLPFATSTTLPCSVRSAQSLCKKILFTCTYQGCSCHLYKWVDVRIRENSFLLFANVMGKALSNWKHSHSHGLETGEDQESSLVEHDINTLLKLMLFILTCCHLSSKYLLSLVKTVLCKSVTMEF